MDPMHCSEVLNTFSSLEDFSVIFDIDLACIYALCAALCRRNLIKMLLVRHIDNLVRLEFFFDE